MKKLLILLVYIVLCILPTSCIMDEPDYSTEVIKIENTFISYWDIDNNHWHCKEALIYVSSKPKDVRFPV